MILDPLQIIGLLLFVVDSVFIVAKDIRQFHRLTVHQAVVTIIPVLAVCAFVASNPSYLASQYGPFAAFGLILLLAGVIFRRNVLNHLKGNSEDFWVARNNPEGIAIVATGPYHYIRHPLYTSLLVYYLGVTCLFFHPLTILAFVLFAIAIILTAFEEEKFLIKTFPDYLETMAGTGMFMPNNLDFLFNDSNNNRNDL